MKHEDYKNNLKAKLKTLDNYTEYKIDKELSWTDKVEEYSKSSEHGVTTISYHIGFTKKMVAFSILDLGIPLVISGVDKIFNDGDWFTPDITHYFDHSTGLEISKDEAQKKKQETKQENEAAELNNEGDALFSKGQYAEAQAKYQAAYDKSQVKDNYTKYSSNKNKAQAEIDAISLNKQGDSLFSEGQYAEAQAKYKEAYDKSQVNDNRTKYSSNKSKAQDANVSLILVSCHKAFSAEDSDNADAAQLFNEALECAQNAFTLTKCKKYQNL